MLEFDTGLLKVGYSQNPRSRVATHGSSAAVHGADLNRVWVSQPSHDAAAREARLIALVCGLATEQRGREWFLGVSFDEVTVIAERHFGSGKVHSLAVEPDPTTHGDEPGGWRRTSAHLYIKGMSGAGSAMALLLWPLLLSERLPGTADVRVSNRWLADRCAEREEDAITRGLKVLVSAGAIRRVVRGSRRSIRLPTATGAVLAPDSADVEQLRRRCRTFASRPAFFVAMMTSAYSMVASQAGRHLDEWARLPGSMADWRRFVGMADNASWTRRVRDLEEHGLIERHGRQVQVSPRSLWNPSARVANAATSMVNCSPALL
jgi:hypothetical protein